MSAPSPAFNAALAAGQNRILEMIARGAPLQQTLDALVEVIEAQNTAVLCELLLMDARERLREGAAPSLPAEYRQAIDGLRIGANAGSAGAAAFLREPVIASDVRNDPRWAPHPELVALCPGRACWATPIIGTDGAVLGTFAMYCAQTRGPNDAEDQLVAVATHLASIAIERHQASARLRASEERFTAVFNVSPVSLIVATVDEGRVLAVNDKFLEVTGYLRDEVVGNTTPQLRVWADLQDRNRALTVLRSFGGVENFEAMLLTKNGETRAQLIAMSPIRLDGQECVLTASADISERKKAEDALRESEERLRQAQKMEAVGQLAGGIAHDFNNLLTAIGGYSELLLHQVSNEFADDVREIRDAAERASALTRQLLAFSRRREVRREVLDLNEIVASMDKLLRRLIGGDVEFATNLDPELAPVEADRGQLEQVIVNLALNARDAMPGGGSLLIETRDVLARDQTRWAKLSVRDSGTGIDTDVVERIFEPFFTTKSAGQGTGLGLSTVASIVEQCGGTIEARNNHGAGATFEVVLPVTSVTRPLEATQLHSVEPKRASTVLVVEDDDILRRLSVRTLRMHGYHVFEARGAAEGFDTWKNKPVDVVVSDVVMPGGSGIELAERLCATGADVRIVLLSGYADPSAAEHLPANCVVAFLAKPFTPGTLLRAVDEAVRRGAPAADADDAD